MSDAITLDHQAVYFAKTVLQTEGELLRVLETMKKTTASMALNYRGVFDYCLKKLNFSEAQCQRYRSVVDKAEEVPEWITAIETGEINLSKAGRIVSVLTSENLGKWVQNTKKLNQRELERKVTEENPKAFTKDRIRPVAKEESELKVLIDLETEKALEKLKDILSQKMGKGATLRNAVEWMTKG